MLTFIGLFWWECLWLTERWHVWMNHHIVKVPHLLVGIDILLQEFNHFRPRLSRDGETGTNELGFGLVLEDRTATGDQPTLNSVGHFGEVLGTEFESLTSRLVVNENEPLQLFRNLAHDEVCGW